MRIRRGIWWGLAVAAFFTLLIYTFFPPLHASKIAGLIREYSTQISDILWLLGFIVLCFALVYGRWGWRAYVGGTPTAAHSRILVDRPIRSSKDDEFKRGHTAEVLARELILPPGRPSVVIALEGPWGCGKSSLLAMIEEKLRQDSPQPVVVHFNPWIFGTVDDLVDRFFRQLAEECAGQGAAPALVTALDGFRRDAERDRINGIAGLILQLWGMLANLVREPTNRRDLLSRKEGVSDLLDRLGRPVVVLVDDVDRLAPEQIRAVFQLIKTMGDFNRVSYLIAYDPDPVYAALDTQWEGHGKEYKDKIVQVTVPFPSQPLSEREAYLRSTWEKASDAWGITISPDHRTLFEQVIPVILRAVHTPRQARIVVNEAFLRASLTKAEIAMPDLLAFSALGVRFPEVIAIIRRRPALVSRRSLQDIGMLGVSEARVGTERENPLRAEVVKVLPDPIDAEQAEALLDFLFRHDDDAPPGVLGRLRDQNNLLLMLYGGVSGNLFSNEEVGKFLYSSDERETILDAHQRGGTVAGFLVYACSGVSQTRAIPALVQLADSLVARAVAIYREHSVDITAEFSKFIFRLLLSSSTVVEEKREAIRRVILNGKFLTLGHELFLRLLRYIGAWDEGAWKEPPFQRHGPLLDWITDSDVSALRDDWLETVAQCPVDLLISREPQPLGILHRRAQLAAGNYGDVQAELTMWLNADAKNVLRFAELYPEGISFRGTDRLVGPDYDLVAAFKHAGVSARQIERLQEDCPIFGNRSLESATPSSEPENVDLSQAVTYDSLSAYTAWKFPGMRISDRIQKLLLRDLNMSRYQTLAAIDLAVQRAEAAVKLYADDHPEMFQFGTDYITKSLGFVDEEFRKKHGFARKTRDAFTRYQAEVNVE